MAILLEIKVIPQSGRQKIVQDKSGIIKCFLKNPPENGKANEELIKFLAKTLGIMHEDIKIIQGATSRKKVLKIDSSLNHQSILQKLGIEKQMGI